jgi:predicted nucleic acid-binding protein
MKTFAKAARLRTLDSLVAATALEEGFTLVSKNRKHILMISNCVWRCPSTDNAYTHMHAPAPPK